LTKEDVIVKITELYQMRLQEMSAKYGATICGGTDLYLADVDIYSPCALGAAINDETINKLKVKVIAGAANNQLENDVIHGQIIREKGITYAPDFLINAGGIINVYAEVVGYDSAEALRRTENIYNTTLEILNFADLNGITTQDAAMRLAQNRIGERKKEIAAK
jgi:leucine dehydrogenase